MAIRRIGLIVTFLSVIGFPIEIGILREASSNACAQESEVDAETKLGLERKDRYLIWMRSYAEGMKVELVGGIPVEKSDRKPGAEYDRKLAKLVPNPVFRYSDDVHRIPDATAWVWTTSEGRPAAFQKVEVNNQGGGKLWTVCFASLFDGSVNAKWPSGEAFAAQIPGMTFGQIPGVEVPSVNPRLRKAQIKSLKDHFSGRFGVLPDGKGGTEARMLPNPLFEYADPKSKMPLGAIFGMSSTDANPSALLVIEARPDESGIMQWNYGLVQLTTYSVHASMNNVEVWSQPAANNLESRGWTYFFLRRDFQ